VRIGPQCYADPGDTCTGNAAGTSIVCR
jgi:hypothetical protein